MSATVTGLKSEKLTTFISTSRYWGGRTHCLLHRTSSTFDVKKAEMSSGVRDVWIFSLPQSRTASIVCQTRDGLVELSACVRQNRIFFCSTRRSEAFKCLQSCFSSLSRRSPQYVYSDVRASWPTDWLSDIHRHTMYQIGAHDTSSSSVEPCRQV